MEQVVAKEGSDPKVFEGSRKKLSACECRNAGENLSDRLDLLFNAYALLRATKATGNVRKEIEYMIIDKLQNIVKEI